MKRTLIFAALAILVAAASLPALGQTATGRINVIANLRQDENRKDMFSIEGATQYPPGCRIDVSVSYEGFPIRSGRFEVFASERGGANTFGGDIKVTGKVLPAIYQIKAVMDPSKQPYKIAEKLAVNVPDSIEVPAEVGSPDERAQYRAAYLEMLKTHIKRVEELNKSLVDNFNKYVPKGTPPPKNPTTDKRKVFDPVEWSDSIKEWNKKIAEYRAEKDNYEKVIFTPLFKTISDDVNSLYKMLGAVSQVANEELYSDLKEIYVDPLTGQKSSRKSFAEWQGKMELALRARYTDLGYKDGNLDTVQISNEITTIKNLYLELNSRFDAATRTEGGPKIEEWQGFSAEWEKRRAEAEVALKRYEKMDFIKKYPSFSEYLFLPKDLVKLSEDYYLMLFGTPEDKKASAYVDTRKRFEITFKNAVTVMRLPPSVGAGMASSDAVIASKKPKELTPEVENSILALMQYFSVPKGKQPAYELLLKMDQVRYQLASDYGAVAVDVIAKKLDDADPYMRDNAATVLGMIADQKATPHLTKYLAGSLKKPNLETTKGYVLEALKKIGDKSASKAVIAMLSDESPDVRAAAADALGAVGDRASVIYLIDRLDDMKDGTKAGDKRARSVAMFAKRSIETILAEDLQVDVTNLSKNELTEVKARLKDNWEKRNQ